MKDILEGSEILEMLAMVDMVDEFMEAVDSDNLPEVVNILQEAGIDDESIKSVLKEITSNTAR